MKGTKFFSVIMTTLLFSTVTVKAAEIPRESAPQNATEESVVITENIIGDILETVEQGDLGYTEAAGYANARVRKAVIAGETGGYGYGLLSAITRNAIRTARDMYLRPEAYKEAEEQMKVLLADIIEEAQNGLCYDGAVKKAYARIYEQYGYTVTDIIGIDKCYLDISTIDSIYFYCARKLVNTQ